MGPAVFLAKGAGLCRRVWRWLARTEVVVVLFLAVLVLVALGSCFPQISPQTATQADQLAQWQTLARARYGALTPILKAAGAFSLYRSPLLWALAALLAVTTFACTLQRWRTNWRAALRQPILIPEPVLDAAPYRAVVQPDTASDRPTGAGDLFGVARVQLRQRGFRVRCDGSTSPFCCRGDRNRLCSLGTLLDHLAVLLLLTGVVLSCGVGWRETLTLAPGQTGEVGHGSGFAVRNDGFRIERYRDGSPAAYTAQVTVVTLAHLAPGPGLDGTGKPGQAGQETMQHEIGVNHPLLHHGARVYLQAYRVGELGYDVTFLVVRDPGYLPVVAAGLLFLAGLIASLYFPRSTIHIRVTPEGLLRFAGWADRRAYEFEHEFAGLTAHVQQAKESMYREQAHADRSSGSASSG